MGLTVITLTMTDKMIPLMVAVVAGGKKAPARPE